MKKILFYSAQAMLVIGSLLAGFVGSNESLILCASCLLCSFLLLLTWACFEKDAWDLFFLGSSVIFVHGYYLSAYTPYGLWLFLAMCASMICALLLLWMQLRRKFHIGLCLEAAAFAKAALIPEILLNMLISKESSENMFVNFSWFLLAFTSLFVIAALWQIYKEKRVSTNWLIACGILQCFFGTDIIGAVTARILYARSKPAEEEPKKSIVSSSAFQRQSKGRIHR